MKLHVQYIHVLSILGQIQSHNIYDDFNFVTSCESCVVYSALSMEKSLAEMNMAVQLNPINKNRLPPVLRDNQRVKDIIYLNMYQYMYT